MYYLLHPPQHTTFCHKELPIQTCSHNLALAQTQDTQTHRCCYIYITACETLLGSPRHTQSVVLAQHVIDRFGELFGHKLTDTHANKQTRKHCILFFSVHQSCHLHNAQCLSVAVFCKIAHITQSSSKQWSARNASSLWL